MLGPNNCCVVRAKEINVSWKGEEPGAQMCRGLQSHLSREWLRTHRMHSKSLAQKTFTKKTSEQLALGLPVKGAGPHTHSALAPKAQRTGKQ